MNVNPKNFSILLDTARDLTPGTPSVGDLFLEILGDAALEQLLLLIGSRMTPSGQPRARLFKEESVIETRYLIVVFESNNVTVEHTVGEDGARWLTTIKHYNTNIFQHMKQRGAEEILPLAEQKQQLRVASRRIQETETLRALNPR